MPPTKKSPQFQLLDAWLYENPDKHQRDPYQSFMAIPDDIRASVRRSMVAKGDDAQAVWSKISMHLQHSNHPQSSAYMERIGRMITLTSVCEDRLNSLFVHRSELMYGRYYSEHHVDMPRKADFLRDVDDIDGNVRAALNEYSYFRNPAVHQSHYHNLLMSDEVMTAYADLFETLKRLRNRQRTILKNEAQWFAADNPQQLQQVWASMQVGTWYPRAWVHEQIGGGVQQMMPFRHGIPLYVVVSQPNQSSISFDLNQLAHTKVWRNIGRNTQQQQQWYVPVLWQNAQRQVQFVKWCTPLVSINKQMAQITIS